MLIKFGVIYMTLTKTTNKTETDVEKEKCTEQHRTKRDRADLNAVCTEVEF